MKILITGGKGMLERGLLAGLGAEGASVSVVSSPAEVTDGDALAGVVLAASPDVVIHCAAMTGVDACESDRDAAFRMNEEGARNVAVACRAAGARLIAVSTDCVFSGDPPREPWAWSETDMPRPRTVFGASMFAGEQMIGMIDPDAVVLRTGWLYGAGGPSFVHRLVRLGAEEGAPIEVEEDRRGNPTSCKVVAEAIRFLLGRPDVGGVVHATCEDACTRYELAAEVKRLLGPRFRRELVPCAGEGLSRPVPRPRNSALRKSVLNLLGYRTPNWRVALRDFVSAEFR